MKRMTIARVRRIFVPALLVLTGAEVVLFGCSSSDRPAGALDTNNEGSIDASASPTKDAGAGADGSTPSTNDDGAAAEASTADGSDITDTGAPTDAPTESRASFTCLDDSPAPDGGSLPTTCPGSTGCSAYCDKISANFKHGVAQTIVECMTSQASCDVFAAANCISQTNERVCVDDASTAQCTTLVTACTPGIQDPDKSAAVSNCVTAMSALSSTGQGVYTSCVQSKTSGGTCTSDDFLGCFDGTYR